MPINEIKVAVELLRKQYAERSWKNQTVKFVNLELRLDDVEALKDAFEELPTIAELSFKECRFLDKSLEALAIRIPDFNTLKVLRLENCRLNHQQVIAVMNAAQSSSLLELDFRGNRLEDKTLVKIAQALPETGMKSLYLGANRITAKGAQALAKIMSEGSLTLTHLELSINPIGQNGAIALFQALPKTRMEILMLERCGIGGVGLNALYDVLPKCPSLEILGLSDNTFNATPMALLMEAVGKSSLKGLLLRSQQFDAASILAMEQTIKTSATLVRLDLQGCWGLTDDLAGTMFLRVARDFPVLHNVSLEGTRMSNELKNEIRKKFALMNSKETKTLVALTSTYSVPRICARSAFRYMPKDLTRRLKVMLTG